MIVESLALISCTGTKFALLGLSGPKFFSVARLDAATGVSYKMAGQFKFLVVIADYEPLSNKFNDDRRIAR